MPHLGRAPASSVVHMEITKHEHACLVIQRAEKRLVIDPGSFTTPLLGVDDIVGVVITHEHPDHWTPDQLKHILDRNPEARIIGPQGVADAAEDFDVEVVAPGDSISIDPFELRFFGGRHAVIHESIPVIDNVGVLVNETLFYPGDSYTVPEGVEVDTLAAPSGAPWLKIGEAMDYVLAVKPRRSFPVHEMTNSVAGKQMANARLQSVTEQNGGQFFALEPGESLSI